VTEVTFPVVAASAGVATGHAVVLHRPSKPAAGNGRSNLTVDEAFDRVAEEFTTLADRLRAGGHAEEADIVAVGALIAGDPELRGDARRAVAEGTPAAEAAVAAADRHAATIEALKVPYLTERAADVRQAGRRAAAVLNGETRAVVAGDGPLVLVADELGPAEMLGLESAGVVAGVSVRGGANSHAAIIARSLGLPLVVGADATLLGIDDGTVLVVDGDRGVVIVGPNAEQSTRAGQAMTAGAARREALAAERGQPCQTLDGHQVGLLCNIATPLDASAGLDAGAEGVGLLRTELPFLDTLTWPDEAAHRAALEPVLGVLAGRSVTVRVLDFGGDKVPAFLTCDTTVRGVAGRGLPGLLRTPDALGAQLRAALAVGRECRLKILVPMVTSLRELHAARVILTEAAVAVGVATPELGVMIEVPSAALIADRLAAEADFLAIGTNDLTEHVLGVKRLDPASRPALAAHPSMLTLINRVVRAGRTHARPVGVCGEAGADPLVLPLLVGLGVGYLSVSPSRVDEVRARIRRLDFADCVQAARDAMTQDSVDDVWDLVQQRCPSNLP
jgi:phosphoenolpyruvate-protein kinase (PTS system EI component)